MKTNFKLEFSREDIERVLKEYIFEKSEARGMLAKKFNWNPKTNEVEVILAFNRSIR